MANMFNTQQNRKIVWDVLVDNKIFADIDPQHYPRIKQEFEKKMATLQALTPAVTSVVALNKKCITEMIEDVSKYKTEVTAADLQRLRDLSFKNGLQSKQSEFDTLHTRPAPPTIDFSDKEIDKPMGSELDAMLARSIAWREKELNLVIGQHDRQAASKWIAPSDSSTSASASTSASTSALSTVQEKAVSSNSAAAIKLLKIGDAIDNTTVGATVLKKRVNFQTAPDELAPASTSEQSSRFLAALKQKDPFSSNTDSVLHLLQSISIKQDQILSRLAELHPR